jgi:hypothetical protein
MPTEIPPPDDDIPGSQSEMNDCITTSDTILDEFVKNSSDEDFISLTELSDSEANSESEDDLEQENINYPLSKDKPASEQIRGNCKCIWKLLEMWRGMYRICGFYK